jgi:hypothetical protein
MNNKLNTPCNQNAQRWYYINAVNKMNNSKSIIEKKYYKKIVDYYLNRSIFRY